MKKQQYLGVALTVVIAITPAVLWLLFTPVRTDAVIKILGLSGLSLLAWNIILSARLIVFDRLFLGLDKMYRLHRDIGTWVVILIMLHYTLLTLKFADISLEAGYQFLLPSKDMALNLGRLAFSILASLTVATLYLKIKYEWFVISMRVLGLTVFLGGYHALFVSGSDLRQNQPLLVFMLWITSLAAFLYIYRSVFRRSTNRLYEYRITKVDVAQNVTDVWLEPVGRPLQFYAGQFAIINFQTKELKNEKHPFTISSGSSSGMLRFSMKGLGDFTKKVQSLKTGTKVQVEGPFGNFSYTKLGGNKQVWVAGGIGITPFLAMAHSLPKTGYEIDLYYCVKSKEEAIFQTELSKIADNNTGLRLTTVITDKDGLLTAENILSKSPGKRDFLLCGPPAMMKSLEKQLITQGVRKKAIHYEEFSLS